MTREEFYANVSCETGFRKSEVKAVFETSMNVIKDALIEDGSFRLPIFGTLKVRDRKRREGTNPKTGEPLIIEAHKKCVLDSSKNTDIFRELNQ